MQEVKNGWSFHYMAWMGDSAAPYTGKTGLTLTVTISKNGGAFGSVSPTVTERGNGWYDVLFGTGDSNTDGPLAIRITGTGANDLHDVVQVVANIENDTYTYLTTNLTTTRAGYLDAAITSRAPASTALSTATWTGTMAGYLDAAISSRAPSSTALSTATWTSARAGYLDNLDTTISSRAAAATALSTATWTATKAGYLDMAISDIPTAAENADAIWDEAASGHVSAGSMGKELQDKLDTTGYTAPDNTNIGLIKTNSDLFMKYTKNKKIRTNVGGVLTMIIYDDDNLTPILQKQLKTAGGDNIVLSDDVIGQELANEV